MAEFLTLGARRRVSFVRGRVRAGGRRRRRMDWAASEYEGKVKVVKVDTDASDSFVKRYSIYGLPTFAVFTDGEGSGFQEGALAKGPLVDYLKKHVPSLSE